MAKPHSLHLPIKLFTLIVLLFSPLFTAELSFAKSVSTRTHVDPFMLESLIDQLEKVNAPTDEYAPIASCETSGTDVDCSETRLKQFDKGILPHVQVFLKSVGIENKVPASSSHSQWEFYTADGKAFENMPLEDLKGKKVLSLGEGTSPLLPYLARQGVNIDGVDLCYDHPENCATTSLGKLGPEWYSCFQKRYILGDASKLTEKYKKDSIDYVVSNALICDLPMDLVEKILDSTIDVLKVGGVATFSSFHDHNASDIQAVLEKINERNAKSKFKLEFTLGHGDVSNPDDKKYWDPKTSETLLLLRIKKVPRKQR